jgi:hypothetical protein
MVTLQRIFDGQHPGSDTCFDNVGTNRFVDCGSTGLGTSNGTVKDAQTGLVWLKNANCFGLMSWADANIKAAALASGQCGLTDGSKAGDWRLATKDEWMAMFRPGCYPSPGGPTIPDRLGTRAYAGGTPWATNVQSADYWWRRRPTRIPPRPGPWTSSAAATAEASRPSTFGRCERVDKR